MTDDRFTIDIKAAESRTRIQLDVSKEEVPSVLNKIARLLRTSSLEAVARVIQEGRSGKAKPKKVEEEDTTLKPTKKGSFYEY